MLTVRPRTESPVRPMDGFTEPFGSRLVAPDMMDGAGTSRGPTLLSAPLPPA